MTDTTNLDQMQKRLAALANKPAEDKKTEDYVQEVVKATMVSAVKTAVTDFAYGVKDMAVAGYKKYVEPTAGPVLKPLYFVFRPVVLAAKWMWDKTDHENYDKKWKQKIAKAGRSCLRGAMMLMAALLIIQGIPNFLGGEYIRAATDAGMNAAGGVISYTVLEPMYDGARMALFMHKETVYPNHKAPTPGHTGSWEVSGCRTPGVCDTEDGVFYHVKPSLMHNFWSQLNKGIPFFIPDHVVGPVANGTGLKCEVTSYGLRWRVFRWLQAYPELLDAKCEAIDGQQTSNMSTPASGAFAASNYATVNFNGAANTNAVVQQSAPAVTAVPALAAKAG